MDDNPRFEVGDLAVLRCQVWRSLNDRTAIVRVPGYQYLLRLLMSAVVEVCKGPECFQANLEAGDSVILRCPIKARYVDGSVVIHVPGYGPLALDRLPEEIGIERTSHQKVVWLTRPPAP